MTEPEPALFPAPAPPSRGSGAPGRVEASLRKLLAAARVDGRVGEEDEPLAESAMVLARVLDTADRVGDLKGGYLAAQAQPPLQKALHALGLPVEIAPQGAALPGNGPTDLSQLLGDHFGKAE